jgi:hypothetical protein
MLLSMSEIKTDRAADTIDNSGELRIEASFGSSHRPLGLPANRIGTVPMHPDKRAVHKTDPAKCFSSKPSNQ